ncbi:MAG: T9SS C-terminal target domain-containing protein [Calditrichaeota bacterium]|nr:MAG: T9SS C-terminal target domain-containing protein [Calditrichota bacterium]
MKILILVILLLQPLLLQAASFSVYEAGYPQHRDPNVKVTDVTDVIERRGLYLEHNIYLTFAYDFQSWFFKNYDELEMEWSFDVPEEVILYDLYYQEGDSMRRAEILDRWTAEFLFNEKTSQYREPALMTMSAPSRNGQVNYNLKLFPLMRNKPQTVMIKYLSPLRATSGAVRTWLPIEQLTMTGGGANKLKLLYRYGDPAERPQLIGKEAVFEQDAAERVWRTTLPITFGEYVEFVLPSPIEDQFYLTTYEQDGNNYYQLAVYPPDLSLPNQTRKILVLIDYNKINTQGLTGELLLSSLKETIGRALTVQDSLALIAGFEELVFSSPDFLPCSRENLDYLFAPIFAKPFLSLNFSQDLLAAAADYIAQNGTAEVLWITNRSDFSTDKNSAEKYAAQIRAIFPEKTVFHVLDLENKKYLTYIDDYGYMSASFPFLRALTHPSGGNLFFLRYHPLKTALAALFFEKAAHFEQVEVQARMANGYTYTNRIFSLFRGYYPLDFPVIQTGKFSGAFPMTVSVIATTGDVQVKKDWIISTSDVIPGSPEIATAYFGNYLQELAYEVQDNWLVSEMIDLSVEARVLSQYTAFLVGIESTQGGEQQPGGNDDNKGGENDWTDPSTKVNQGEESNQLSFSAFPNPFNPNTALNIILPQAWVGERLTVEIYDVLGRKVRSFQYTSETEVLTLVWDATDDLGVRLPSGTYFAVVTVKNVRLTVKLLYMK